MKMKVVFISFVLSFFISISACSQVNGGLKLVNEREIEMGNIAEVLVEYRSADIVFLNSNNASIIVREYMNINKESYYADVSDNDGQLIIKNGASLLTEAFLSFAARIEIYIPDLRDKRLVVSTTSGKIIAEEGYVCSHLNLKTLSGEIALKASPENSIIIKTVSGKIRCEGMAKNMEVRTISGRIMMNNVAGRIFVKSVSGNMDLNPEDGVIVAETLSGNIHSNLLAKADTVSFATKSGNVDLNIRNDLGFSFWARTPEGKLSAPFIERLNVSDSDKKILSGGIGDNPTDCVINIRTNSGRVRVEQTEN